MSSATNMEQGGGAPAERPSLMPANAPTRQAAPAVTDPTQRTDAPAQGVQADPGAPPPEPPPYENPWLEKQAKGKYRTLDEYGQHVEGIHKGMKEAQTKAAALEMRLGQWKGPPVGEDGQARDYALRPREGSKLGDFDPKSPEFEGVNRWGKKWGCPEDALQELVSEVYEPMMEAVVDGNTIDDQSRMVQRYGTPEAAAQALDALGGFLCDELGEEMWPQIRRAITTDDAMQVFELLMQKKSAGPSLIGKGQPGAAGKADTWESILAMQMQSGWEKDQANVDRRQRFFEEEAARRGPSGKDVTVLREARANTTDQRTPQR